MPNFTFTTKARSYESLRLYTRNLYKYANESPTSTSRWVFHLVCKWCKEDEVCRGVKEVSRWLDKHVEHEVYVSGIERPI